MFTFSERVLGDIFILCIMWSMFSSAAFFGSGHQNTIPSVRYPAAYIGFYGSIHEIIPQGNKIRKENFVQRSILSLNRGYNNWLGAKYNYL